MASKMANPEAEAAYIKSLTKSRKAVVAVTQQSMSWNRDENVDKAEKHIREAAAKGANIILISELFEAPYFCQDQRPDYFKLAHPVDDHPLLQRFQKVAKELGVVLPISFFERSGNAHYNSLACIDADGTILDVYRKSHIPDGCGYEEKFYFNPGDTGFKVVQTQYGRVGLLVCWDQWFPEGARICALMDADVIVYPTAIGSEPQDPTLVSYLHWVRTQIGHACANVIPVVTSNRIGKEVFTLSSSVDKPNSEITFYGGGFIAGPTGDIVAQIGKNTKDVFPDPKPDQIEGVALAEFDFEEIKQMRASWGLFRDRRPDLYKRILTLDGKNGYRGECHDLSR